MIRYLYADELRSEPQLQHSMFLDRADQFKTRLGWDVSVDKFGYERDQYDGQNPLYVIYQKPDGSHGGSMRLLPTTGRTMVNDYFLDILGGGEVRSPAIWECTRFCLSRDAEPRTAAALMLAGGEVMENFGVKHFVGVFDARMVRIYRMIGASPEVLGRSGSGKDEISVGLWSFTESSREKVSRKAGITPTLSRLWFERAFGSEPQKLAQSA
ncbi:acyl-homoserine-lactone synthase [Planktotalea sp.]|uniref:acyl-homoserine-lactone synthase n=1 Tax=Planktotalea sp. TaxID=2029877 RepID=UPI003D6AC6C9